MGQAANHRQQGLLRRVGGIGVIAGEAPADRVQPVVVDPEQGVQCDPIAGLGRCDQDVVAAVDAAGS